MQFWLKVKGQVYYSHSSHCRHHLASVFQLLLWTCFSSTCSCQWRMRSWELFLVLFVLFKVNSTLTATVAEGRLAVSTETLLLTVGEKNKVQFVCVLPLSEWRNPWSGRDEDGARTDSSSELNGTTTVYTWEKKVVLMRLFIIINVCVCVCVSTGMKVLSWWLRSVSLPFVNSSSQSFSDPAVLPPLTTLQTTTQRPLGGAHHLHQEPLL